MKISWLDIHDEQFEEVVAALLRAMGYQNVTVRTGGGDDGWDIDAQFPIDLPDGTHRADRWRIECKRYRNSPPAEKILHHFHRMVGTLPPLPDDLLFVTTASFTNPTKRDLEDLARERRVRVTWWERERLDALVQEYLDNGPLRSLLAPYIEPALPSSLLASACRRQVAVEIERRVGRKYLPELWQARPIEAKIRSFIAADLETVQVWELCANLQRLPPPVHSPLHETWRKTLHDLAGYTSWREADSMLSQLFDIGDEGLRKVLLKWSEESRRLKRNCFLIRDKAGSGKTNLLCHLTSSSAEPSPLFLFLSCKFDLPQNHSLEDVIAAAFLASLEHEGQDSSIRFHNSRDLLRAVDLTLRREKAQLVVLLDGINENRDLAALDNAITDLLVRWNGLPIKFVITCRDIFWSFFDEKQWAPFLFDGGPHELPGFEEEQIDGVIDAYFRVFDIRGILAGAAREKCRHPLLLRFFCEAHQGRDIREYRDLRLKDLFAEYWERKQEEIAGALGWGKYGGRRVEAFVYKIVDHLASHRATQLLLGDLSQVTGEEDLESERSLYKRLLDQEIILEEIPPETAFDRSYRARRISFVYNEFYDYMTALAHVRNNDWEAKAQDPKSLCLDFLELVGQSAQFEQFRGIIEYLVLIAEQKGLHPLLCAILARLGHVEILCNLLPKLKDDGDWMEEVLAQCLLSIHEYRMSSVKRSTGWRSPDDLLKDLLNNTEDSRLYEALTGTRP